MKVSRRLLLRLGFLLEALMLKEELLKILACPKCKGDLEYDSADGWLSCSHCRLRYPVRDDIPIMLIEEAEPF